MYLAIDFFFFYLKSIGSAKGLNILCLRDEGHLLLGRQVAGMLLIARSLALDTSTSKYSIYLPA